MRSPFSSLHTHNARSPHLAFAALSLCLAANAWSGPLSCNTSASPVTLDPTSSSAELGELTLACSGGVQGDPLLSVSLQAFFNAEILQDTAPTLSDGTNMYSADFASINSILFDNVLLDPFSTTLTMSNVFVDATLLAANLQVLSLLAVTPAGAVAIANPQQALARQGDLPTPVPEPTSAWLFGLAATALLGSFAWRRR